MVRILWRYRILQKKIAQARSPRKLGLANVGVGFHISAKCLECAHTARIVHTFSTIKPKL